VVALSLPQLEPDPVPVRKAGKWSSFFGPWSWVPAAACAGVLLAAVGIGVVKKSSEHTIHKLSQFYCFIDFFAQCLLIELSQPLYKFHI